MLTKYLIYFTLLIIFMLLFIINIVIVYILKLFIISN